MKKIIVLIICLAVALPAFAKNENKNIKQKTLPPGLQKKLERTGELPPGWQKKIVRKKVLIAYDSRHGSTSAVVEAISEVLLEDGFLVETDLAYKINDISSYDAVIIGSPIYWATLQPDIKSFMSTFKDTLSGLQVALFVVCSTIDETTGLIDPAAKNFFVTPTLEDYPEITFLEPIGLFGGVIDLKKLFPFEFLNMKYTGYGVGDFRNTDVVVQWAETVSELFK